MKDYLKNFIRRYQVLYFLAEKIRRLMAKIPIVGQNNRIHNKGVTINVTYNIRGNNNYIEIQPRTRLLDVAIYIKGDDHRLIIGENCRISGGSLWFEDQACQIRIGTNTTIESAHIAVSEPNCQILIGEDCMLSEDIVIRTGDSHSVIDVHTGERINYAQNVELCDHIWVGERATILKGVRVNAHSIIGAGAIVTSDVPANTLVAGIPAKVVKRNIDWIRERVYHREEQHQYKQWSDTSLTS